MKINIKEIEKISLSEDEVLVIRLKENLYEQKIDDIIDSLSRFFPDEWKTKIICINSDGIEFTKLKINK